MLVSNTKHVHIHDDLKLGCHDFTCNMIYSLNLIRLIHVTY